MIVPWMVIGPWSGMKSGVIESMRSTNDCVGSGGPALAACAGEEGTSAAAPSAMSTPTPNAARARDSDDGRSTPRL